MVVLKQIIFSIWKYKLIRVIILSYSYFYVNIAIEILFSSTA